MKKLFTLLLLTAITLSVHAQEATLEETLTFLKLKTSKKADFLYTNSNEVLVNEEHIKYVFGDFVINELKGKTLILSNEKGELMIDLSLIQAIEARPYLILSSTTSFFTVKYNGVVIEPDNKLMIRVIGLEREDRPRVEKAFKHLLKLLKISLPESKF